MKGKILCVLMAAMMCFQLVGCTSKSNEPLIANDGKSFLYTNQELVDLLNKGAEENDIPTILYDGKRGDYNISGAGLKYKVRPYKPEEQPECISLYFYPQNNATKTALGYYVSTLLGLTDPESLENISNEIFSVIESNPTSYTINGVDGTLVKVLIVSYGSGGHVISFQPMSNSPSSETTEPETNKSTTPTNSPNDIETRNDDLSAAFTEYMYLNFGGGYESTPEEAEELAADWYSEIINIYGYDTADNQVNAIIVADEKTLSASYMANALMMNYKDVKISSIQVVSTDGNVLYQRDNPKH